MGTYTSAGTPSSRAAVATPRPWLPPEAVTTRRGRSPASSAFSAPLSLNEPVSCWCSNFNTRGRPSTSTRSNGVRRRYGRMRLAAAHTISLVGTGPDRAGRDADAR